MLERGYSLFAPQRLLQMWNFTTSNAAVLPSTLDEEFADEADEPPDDDHNPADFLPHSYHGPSLSDGEFVKHTVRHPVHTESLLTRALTSPEILPVDRKIAGGGLQRGFSTSSTWSNVSTADLTSDGLTSPSRSSTPSPPPPMFLGPFMDMLPRGKPMMTEEPKALAAYEKRDEVAEELGRKRCITFACANKPPGRRVPEQPKAPLPQLPEPAEQPKRSCALKFVCTQRDDEKKKSNLRRRSPLAATAAKRAEAARDTGRELEATVTASVDAVPEATAAMKLEVPEPRAFYDSEGVGNSWTNQPIDKSRLLKVDGLLQKELDIRKLSEEAEEEALQEEEEEEQDDEVLDEDDDVDEDEDQDDDEDESEDGYDGESGNETDNEEGFASDDDSDDEFFGGSKPIAQYYDLGRPLFRRNRSSDSIESVVQKATPRPIRPHTPELPDSTDFVCGTLDEDRPLEDAYLSCMEERRRSKHIPTPQDIDPSFPVSDNEDDNDAEVSNRSDWEKRGRKHVSTATATSKAVSRSPRNRVHSPAPLRRINTTSPGPSTRRNASSRSRASSPAPRRSRHNSPAPPRRARSPAPIRKNKHHSQFNHSNNVVHTKSLPRTSGFAYCKAAATGLRNTSAAASPEKTHTQPMFIRRGAADIFKGLEKRRERRKARLTRTKGPHVKDGKAGEGVEKMREVALEICGKGRRPPAQWVISA